MQAPVVFGNQFGGNDQSHAKAFRLLCNSGPEYPFFVTVRDTGTGVVNLHVNSSRLRTR